jgi:hypothetical protein
VTSADDAANAGKTPDAVGDGATSTYDDAASAPDDDASAAEDVPGAERIPSESPQHSRLYVGLSAWMLHTEAWLRSHGGTRLRIGLRAFWAVVAVVGVVLLVGPVINKPLSFDDILSSADSENWEWIARDFAADYRISTTAEGALNAEVEERITANFDADSDENGIRRVLATQFQGHALAPSALEATLDGTPVSITTTESATRLTVSMQGAERLLGDHEFVLRYRLQDLASVSTDTATGKPIDLLEWNVFGPSWPQGVGGLDVRVTLPQQLDEQLIRQPRAGIVWTLLSGGDWLTAEPGTGPDVTYHLTNDQNLPPNSAAWFAMKFEPGTFTMPQPSPLFWVQSFGPLVPLVFLALTLLLAFAARAVAWSDARGRPWFVAQFEPPKKVTPGMAAQILRAPVTRELAVALATAQAAKRKSPERRALLIAAAKVARRTGRLGDRAWAISRSLAAAENHAQLAQGMRRIPRGFVRDLFIAAPLALTVLQCGLVRQLSEQEILSVIWWPVAFVAVSFVIAAIVLWIALSVRPLTRKGALVKQHLQGIGVYAERALLLERAETSDPLLPYAVLTAPPRAAGRQVAGLIEAELGSSQASRGWRIGTFLSWPRMVVRLLAPLLVVVAFGVAVFVPVPSDGYKPYASYSWGIPGGDLTEVQSLDASAVLSRTSEGKARVDVTQRLSVTFSPSGPDVPQFVQQWPNLLDGQDLDLQVESVTIDGSAVPFVTQQDFDTLLMRTTLDDVLDGTHDLRIDYALTSAAVATEFEGELVDSVRWAALLDGWEYESQWDNDPVPDSLRFEFSLADDLAALATASGWLSKDTTDSSSAANWPPSVIPFDAAASVNNRQTHVLTIVREESGAWPFDVTVDDVGVRAVFPPGTFVGPDVDARHLAQFLMAAPALAALSAAGLALLLGLTGVVAGAIRSRRVFTAGLLRDLVWWLAPAAMLAAITLFFWAGMELSDTDPLFPMLGWPMLASVLACVAGLVLTRGSRGR